VIAVSTLASLGSEPVHSRRRRSAPRPRPDAKPFDPSHPGRLASAHRRALVLVFEAFARQLTTSLAGQLRTAVSVSLRSVDQRDYASLIASSDEPTWIAAVGLGTVSGLAVLEIPVPLGMMLAERLLGGNGSGANPMRSLTDLEKALVTGLVELGLVDLANALAPLYAIQPQIVRAEDQAELLKAAPQAEAYAVTNFAVDLPDTETGAKRLTIALPLIGLEPAFEAFAGGARKTSDLEQEPASIGDHLLDTSVGISLRFGPVPMRAHDVLDFTEGQILRLGHRTGSPLAVDVEGVPFLSANPGRIGRRLACVVVEPSTDSGATTT
jgi:flagellar motor switch protein FliM